jgi:protein-S-isoprenylcysteine O-methyltransferase Ste14
MAPGQTLPSLGRRGEGWFALQMLLVLTTAALGFVGPTWPWHPILIAIGVLLAVVGAGIALAGIVGLGTSLTPLPKPRDRSTLREDGIFGMVRHPIYSGAIALAFGWSLATTPLALAATVVGSLFVELKSRREEAWLLERYPAYQGYRRRVRWKFVPGIR